jgi:hypothetical protein
VTPIEQICSNCPGIEEKAMNRLLEDGGVFDTGKHILREGIATKEEARAIILLASKTALKCGFKHVLTRDEEELMARKFVEQ